MNTTQRITPTTPATPSVSNDKLKKAALYGGSATVMAAALAAMAKVIIGRKDPVIDDPEKHPVEGDGPVADGATDPTVQPEGQAQAQAQTHTHTQTTTNGGSAQNVRSRDHETDTHSDDPVSDPDKIAEEIIEKEEIDENDEVETPNIIFDKFTVYYDSDGNEFPAVLTYIFGEPRLLVDHDLNGTFTDVFDMAGKFLTTCDFPFTEDDIRYAMENDITYIDPKSLPEISDIVMVDEIESTEEHPAVAQHEEPATPDDDDDIDITDEDIQAIISAIINSPLEGDVSEATVPEIEPEVPIVVDDEVPDVDDEVPDVDDPGLADAEVQSEYDDYDDIDPLS